MPEIGSSAPDFELPDQDGKPVRLSQFRGKKVVIFAYPKADTPGCTTQACGFRDNYPHIKTSNAVVLGISPDKPRALRKWKDAKKLPYTLLSDPDHRVLEAWGVWDQKSLFGRIFDGVIRSHWVIDEKGVVLDERIGIGPEDSVKFALEALGEA